MPARMGNQMPTSCARSATGRRRSRTNLRASRRISTQLLSSAKSGASGHAATKMVTKPNCSTAGAGVSAGPAGPQPAVNPSLRPAGPLLRLLPLRVLKSQPQGPRPLEASLTAHRAGCVSAAAQAP